MLTILKSEQSSFLPKRKSTFLSSKQLITFLTIFQAYHKNYFHNIINVFERQDLSLKQAMDCVGTALNDRYRRWYLALADMPIYGYQVDKEVHEYV